MKLDITEKHLYYAAGGGIALKLFSLMHGYYSSKGVDTQKEQDETEATEATGRNTSKRNVNIGIQRHALIPKNNNAGLLLDDLVFKTSNTRTSEDIRILYIDSEKYTKIITGNFVKGNGYVRFRSTKTATFDEYNIIHPTIDYDNPIESIEYPLNDNKSSKNSFVIPFIGTLLFGINIDGDEDDGDLEDALKAGVAGSLVNKIVGYDDHDWLTMKKGTIIEFINK